MDNTKESNNTSLTIAEPCIAEFKEIIKDIASNPNVISLRERTQHENKSRYYHCLRVSYYTYYLCKKLGLDYVSAARGAMLHDFYFYDWRDKKVEGQKKFHAFRHPNIALKNAIDLFDLNDKEKDIIEKHMWPLTIVPPKCKEGYIVTLVDKYCATNEFIKNVKNKISIKINHNNK